MFLDKRRVLRVSVSDDDLTSAKTSSERGRAVHFKEPIQTERILFGFGFTVSREEVNLHFSVIGSSWH